MIGLTEADTKHWAPIPAVVDWLANILPPAAKVLEIGASHVQFPRATMFVDFQSVPGIPPERLVKCDIATERLPFPDKYFDFVYCRHTLEDLHNPFPACEEMSRVAKAGYIETPSPIAELCRGVDGGSPAYRGYHHHRYIVWARADGSLHFVSKYPLVEYLNLDDKALISALRRGPKYWNTYYLWEDKIDFFHRQNSLNFDMMQDYPTVLRTAIEQSRDETMNFWHGRMKVAALQCA